MKEVASPTVVCEGSIASWQCQRELRIPGPDSQGLRCLVTHTKKECCLALFIFSSPKSRGWISQCMPVISETWQCVDKKKSQLHPLIQTTDDYWEAVLFQGFRMNKQGMHIFISYCYVTHSPKLMDLSSSMYYQPCVPGVWLIWNRLN